VTGRWFALVTLVSSTNKTDSHDITEILLKVGLNTITLTIIYPLANNVIAIVDYVYILKKKRTKLTSFYTSTVRLVTGQ
jgi:hypothetical protein